MPLNLICPPRCLHLAASRAGKALQALLPLVGAHASVVQPAHVLPDAGALLQQGLPQGLQGSNPLLRKQVGSIAGANMKNEASRGSYHAGWITMGFITVAGYGWAAARWVKQEAYPLQDVLCSTAQNGCQQGCNGWMLPSPSCTTGNCRGL